MAKFADNLTDLGLLFLGLALALTPLALWVAWTDTILLVVLYCVLVHVSFEETFIPRAGLT